MLSVHLGEALDLRPMADLTEQEMFALVALRTQESLTEEELADVTNMSRTQIRGTVKHLVGSGVLKRTAEGVSVVVSMIPIIDITLRRRRFMHGAAQ